MVMPAGSLLVASSAPQCCVVPGMPAYRARGPATHPANPSPPGMVERFQPCATRSRSGALVPREGASQPKRRGQRKAFVKIDGRSAARLPETDCRGRGRIHRQRDQGETNPRPPYGTRSDRGPSDRRNQHSPGLAVEQALHQGTGSRIGKTKIQEALHHADSQVAVETHPRIRSGSRRSLLPHRTEEYA